MLNLRGMILRYIKEEDASTLAKIYKDYHSNDFYPPTLDNTITSAVVEENKVIVGYGLVKLYAEATMILDMSKPLASRIMALDKLMFEAVRACKEAEIKQLHVHVKNDKLVRLLSRKFDFDIVTDTVMVHEVE